MDNQNENELKHHGVKGQRWGFRRYQNKDGSLTPAGRKRADKLKNKYLEVTGKKLVGRAISTKGKTTSQNEENTNKKKSIKEMSNEELRSKTTRMNLEREYLNAVSSMKDINPKQVSKGQKLVELVATEMIKPAAINVGKQAFNTLFAKSLNNTLNLEKEYKIHTNNQKK